MGGRESRERSAAMEVLCREIARWTEHGESFDTAVPGLTLYRKDRAGDPIVGAYEPSICLVAQGAKRVQLGDETYLYDAQHYLITAIHLPTVVRVVEASPDRPYLGLSLTFDMREVSQLMADSELPPPQTRRSTRGMATGVVTPQLASALGRLVELLRDEQDIPILAPIIQREIIYRVLVGEQGGRLRQIAAAGSQSQQISRAIGWLRENYSKPLRVADLAELARMSTSTFHHHFRAMTALSPLQYQKQLRLREARRLMLAEHFDAAAAAFEVGYESPSQFSREYSREFGAPPLRDVTTLRQMAVAGTS